MHKRSLLLLFCLGLLGLTACKSQFELILSGDDVPLKYKTAFELFEAEKYAKAARMFENLKLATSGTPQDDTVQFYTALSHYEYGDIYSAEPAFEGFINVFPLSPFTERAKFLRIDCLYRQTLRYELDQTPSVKALNVMLQYLYEHPTTPYRQECEDMIADLNERMDRKDYEAAKLYYTIEEYKAAHYAFKNILKNDAENVYREDIRYYTALSAYKYAFNSVSSKQKERYMTFADEYYNFIGEFPESAYRAELDALFERIQKYIK